MNEFDELLKIADRLNGPDGCPWDRKQNFNSLQPYVIEEANEVVEAVDEGEDQKIIEELGDLLYTIIFYAKLGEKEERFTIKEIINSIKEKLVRRHPHVFGELKVDKAEEVVQHWERIKKGEKGHSERQSALDGIPKTLPLLAKAQKILKRIKKHDSSLLEKRKKEDLGEAFVDLVLKAEEEQIDAETALRRTLASYEKAFRERETMNL